MEQSTNSNGQKQHIVWHEDVLMKQLILYAVGVWMGRYRLDKKVLYIAHPNPTEAEMQPYWYGGVPVYIDDDGLIPVLPQSSPFDDNLSSRISDFVRITFREDKLTENRAATLSTAENRKLQNLQKALEECREYHERLQVVAEQAIAFDLDNGVVVNYAKFGNVLAKIK